MVTVISSKEKSTTTPVSNGVTGGSSCDNERPFQFIKDYQEVDFHRTSSCKPLPKDLFDTIDGRISKSSIEGMFFLQIDSLELSNTNQDQSTHLLLTLTDGISTVKAITNQSITNLTWNTKIGSKLLLTDTIAIQNGLLQLTHDNTKFHAGSNTYPRPRPPYRGNRGNRSSNDGRRNNRYDNDGNDNNFSKRQPPKTTLMDFLPLNKIPSDEIEVDKPKDFKRQSNGNNSISHSVENEVNVFEQDGFDEPSDYDDDPTHGNHRERRNPLPPRLQRAQEERSRRNPNRFYDESMGLGNVNNHPLSSTIPAHLQHVDQSTYTTYASSLNGSTGTHLNYYSTNPTQFIYNLTSISTPTYPNHQPLLAPTYPNETINYCCSTPYGNYLPINGNGEGKIHSNNEIGLDDANDSGMKSESSSNEPKSTSPPSTIVSSSNDNQTNFSGGKRRDSNTVRPRWKIGDMCLARWSEDGEFYYATVVDIRPPFCTVLFIEYHTYDQVHFSHLKVVPRDQQFYSLVPPSSDLQILPPNAYYAPRTNFYTSTIDGCIIMPEVPPFPFNSSGTLYMCPTPSNYPPMMQSNDLGGGGAAASGGGDLTMNSSSSPSKDSNDTSVIDSTSTSTDDKQQQQEEEEQTSSPQPCSIADAPLTLVTPDDFSQLGLNRMNIHEDQPSTEEEEEEIRE